MVILYYTKPHEDSKGKSKSVPLQVESGPECSRKLRFPDFMTAAQDVGTLRPYAPAAFTPKKCSWYLFLLEAESTAGPLCNRKDYVKEIIQ